MISSIRRISKSRFGAIFGILFLAAIAASFALGDVQNVLSGGTQLQSNELASVGSETVTDQDLDRAMQQRLSQLRQQNPNADYSQMAGDVDQMLAAMIDERALSEFARKSGFNLSKLLVDAEIASIPGARGITGQFTDDAYRAWLGQQRLTDADVRRIIRTGLLQQLMIAPVAANARASVGIARPYASMLLEQRTGQVAFLSLDSFRAGINPSDQDVQRYYAANRQRYTIPQQRVLRLAKLGSERVADVTATDEEIANYYRQNQQRYAARETRNISQAVVPDQAAAQAIAQRARGGASFVQAVRPAGLSAQDVSVGQQSREQLADLASEDVAKAAFAAQDGAVVGPIRSELGWHVVKIEGIEREGGRTLEQARGEIAETLTASKRQEALTDLISRVEDELAGGASMTEAAAAANLEIVETPLITASGSSRENRGYTLPEEYAPALRSGFEMGENEEPAVETLPENGGYLLVSVARIVEAAPAPLAEIRDRVRSDLITGQATAKARAAAKAIADRAGKASLREAAAAAKVQAQVETINARRMQLNRFEGQVPPPLALLFSMGQGTARSVSGAQGEGFYVVKVDKIVPGNALNSPGLISQTQQQLQETLSQEYAQQFMQAIRQRVGVERNEKAIAEARQRIIGGR